MPLPQLIFRKTEYFLPNLANDGLDFLSFCDLMTRSLRLRLSHVVNNHLRFRFVIRSPH